MFGRRTGRRPDKGQDGVVLVNGYGRFLTFPENEGQVEVIYGRLRRAGGDGSRKFGLSGGRRRGRQNCPAKAPSWGSFPPLDQGGVERNVA